MKRVFVCVLLATGAALSQAQAQATWFTVAGDRANASVDTVEVNLEPQSTAEDKRVMQIRVSRQASRISWQGTPYRSYVAMLRFDCIQGTALFQRIDYYSQPLWTGQPYKTVTYGEDEPRYMVFKDMQPNPAERIIKAACSIR